MKGPIAHSASIIECRLALGPTAEGFIGLPARWKDQIRVLVRGREVLPGEQPDGKRVFPAVLR